MQKKVFAKFNALLDWQRTKESKTGTPNQKPNGIMEDEESMK